VSDKLKPNFTPIPNVILDEIMRKLSPGATKILFAICRFTYGYGKQFDRISLSQLAECTGLDRRSVSRSVKQLGAVVTITPGNVTLASEYRLNIEILDTDLETICHQGQNAARGIPSDRSVPFQRKPKKEEREHPKFLSHSEKGKPARPPLAQFELSDGLRGWCDENGIPISMAETELPRFVDWHLAKGKRPKDTAAAFRNWLRKAKEFQPNINGSGHANPTVKDIGNGLLEVDGLKMLRKDYERKYGRAAV
jgi:phage replication O-like protein O